jgi:putative spermidine/putrescine transport system ATP-binding protein
VGPSGCGKSTLSRIIAGFVRQITDDIVIDELPAEQREVGIVFQNYARLRCCKFANRHN